MKRFLVILICLFSNPCFGKWSWVMEDLLGNTFYLDVKKMKKVDGDYYVWLLSDNTKPWDNGVLSWTRYYQVDCKYYRVKVLNQTHYNGPMGTGEVNSRDRRPDKEWTYPRPDTTLDLIFKNICIE